MTDNCKKNFQRCCQELREKYRNNDYPKAMMTAAQIANNTATVNVGGEWSSVTKERCQDVMKERAFRLFLLNENATAKIERRKYRYLTWFQIRITFYPGNIYKDFSEDRIREWLAGGDI